MDGPFLVFGVESYMVMVQWGRREEANLKDL